MVNLASFIILSQVLFILMYSYLIKCMQYDHGNKIKPMISLYNLQISKDAHKLHRTVCSISFSNRDVPVSWYSVIKKSAYIMLSSRDLKNPKH